MGARARDGPLNSLAWFASEAPSISSEGNHGARSRRARRQLRRGRTTGRSRHTDGTRRLVRDKKLGRGGRCIICVSGGSPRAQYELRCPPRTLERGDQQHHIDDLFSPEGGFLGTSRSPGQEAVPTGSDDATRRGRGVPRRLLFPCRIHVLPRPALPKRKNGAAPRTTIYSDHTN